MEGLPENQKNIRIPLSLFESIEQLIHLLKTASEPNSQYFLPADWRNTVKNLIEEISCGIDEKQARIYQHEAYSSIMQDPNGEEKGRELNAFTEARAAMQRTINCK